ncbi:MAG: hypothetical protein HRT65_13995 [Flavobacteriaceae bacterium]|nr:hypothetical protein [Flavobacteriaceae bacterium]
MNIFPEKNLNFELVGEETESLNRLKRRTEKSEYFTSQPTDKSFRGKIIGNNFKVISSTIGKGAFCVMSGGIEHGKGIVKVEMNKAFRILFTIAAFVPSIIYTILAIFGKIEFEISILFILVLQIIFVRFVIIELVFWRLSKESLNRLRDVLDLNWILK